MTGKMNSMVFVVINDKSKKVSSRSGMSHTRQTSRFYQYWLDHVDEDIQSVKEAINNKDFKHLGEVRRKWFRMHYQFRCSTYIFST